MRREFEPYRHYKPAAADLPMASAEDVELSEELADRDDIQAQQRADEADRRATAYDGEEAP